MKTFLQTLFFFLLVTQICFAQWFWQNPLPQGNNLNAVSFSDEDNATAVGDFGTIIRTTNGGASWTIQESKTTHNLRGVCFTNENNGTAVGESGAILNTNDSGLI